MFYEDVKLQKGQAVSQICADYGYTAAGWAAVWSDPKNALLASKRGKPEHMQVEDTIYIPIPWKVISRSLFVVPNGVHITLMRNGQGGKCMSWVQTVYRHNQPIGPNPDPFCVDGCTPDDDLPFYWTDAEIAANPSLRTTFKDTPSRSPPSSEKGTTRWRAVVSLAVVTKKRITVYDSSVWGFDMQPSGAVSKVGPRAATPLEVTGHLRLLQNGVGTSNVAFKNQGWVFRRPPGFVA